MHLVMLEGVMRAPLTFFDTTPTGRIISRFAKDVDVLDTSLPQQISDSIYCMYEVISFFNDQQLRMTMGDETTQEMTKFLAFLRFVFKRAQFYF